ncbi:MAG: glycosyltransferase [Pseudomonadales bacterium]|nr:glycosyltransferase [Pseudomonadales bacterium]
MRILLISTSYPRQNDGTEAAGSFVEDFVSALSKIAEVAVVAPGFDQELVESCDGIDIYRFVSTDAALSTLNPFNPLQWQKIFGTLSSGQRCSNNAVKEFRPDHILALWALPSGYWARSAGRKYNIPYSTWALGSDIWSLGTIPFVRKVLKSVLVGAQVQFADGYDLSVDVRTISNSECHFLPSTRVLETQNNRLRDTWPYRLSFLGRWHSNKGIDILLDALMMLSDDDWEKIDSVRIEGGGPLDEVVREKATVLSRLDRPVRIGQYLNRDEAKALLVNTDYLIIPSRIESIPVIFSDAMQCKCPVIVTPVGDLPRLLREYQCGILVDDVTPEAIVDGIKKALATMPISYEKGLLEASTLFDIDKSARKCVDLLEKQ